MNYNSSFELSINQSKQNIHLDIIQGGCIKQQIQSISAQQVKSQRHRNQITNQIFDTNIDRCSNANLLLNDVKFEQKDKQKSQKQLFMNYMNELNINKQNNQQATQLNDDNIQYQSLLDLDESIYDILSQQSNHQKQDLPKYLNNKTKKTSKIKSRHKTKDQQELPHLDQLDSKSIFDLTSNNNANQQSLKDMNLQKYFREDSSKNTSATDNSLSSRQFNRQFIIDEHNRKLVAIQYVDDETKSEQKKWMAKSWINRGYGYHFILQEIQAQGITLLMNNYRYKTVSCAFATEVYREIQNFLINQCGKKIKPKSMKDIRVLYTIMLRSKSNFPIYNIETLTKFVRKTYELGNPNIYPNEAVDLYLKIQSQLHQKLNKYDKKQGKQKMINLVKLLKSNNKPKQAEDTSLSQAQFFKSRVQSKKMASILIQPDKMKTLIRDNNWCSELERIAIQLYIQFGRVSNVRDCLHIFYPFMTKVITNKLVKHQIFRLLRIAIKKFQRIYKFQTEISLEAPLVTINQISMKKIIQTSGGSQIRSLLFRFLLQETNITVIRLLSKRINEYVRIF